MGSVGDQSKEPAHELLPPPCRRRKREPFVVMPIWWAKATANATNSPAMMLLVELLRLRTGHSTFPVPNGRLRSLGVSRDTKRRVLRDLERARLIVVDRVARKTPIVTLIGL
jgi:hypothetical protein